MPTLRSPVLERPSNLPADAPAQQPRRDPWFDNIKMALIVLVVVGHTWTLLLDSRVVEWCYDFVYSWHMPAFVLVTGYLSRSMTWSGPKLWSLVRTVAVPYLVFESALALYRDRIGGVELEDLFKDPHYPLWFLVALLLWRLAAPAFLRLPRAAALGLALAASTIGGLYVGETLDLSRVLGFLPFFVLGLHLRAADWDRLRTSVPTGWAVGGLIAALGASRLIGEEFGRSWFYYNSDYPGLADGHLQAIAIRLLLIGVGLLGTFSFLVLVPRGRSWFTALGAATLVVYLFHPFAVLALRYSDYPSWATDHLATAFALTTAGAVALALLLAAPPVARVLAVFTDPLGHLGRLRRRTSSLS
jgi:fucose 4-O-acetylase-like acetyltransferase